MQARINSRKADDREVTGIEINIVYRDPADALASLDGAVQEARKRLMQAAPAQPARDTRTY